MADRYQKLSPMLVEPAYCAEERVWFLEDGTTAASLAELQAQLPHAVIEGYYPKGFRVDRPKATEPTLRLGFRWSQERALAVVSHSPPSRPLREQFEQVPPEPEPEVTEAVFEEPRHRLIAERAQKAAAEARAALSKEPPPPPAKRAYTRRMNVVEGPRLKWLAGDDVKLAKLVKRGLTSAEIAALMPPRTRNSVIGRCHRLKLVLQG